jgi:hypothetical protein
MSTELDRITELAKEDPKRQFYSIAHMITFGALYAAFRGLRKKASAGVDGVTYEEYERDVAGNLQTLHERLKNGKYQAQPKRAGCSRLPLSRTCFTQISPLLANIYLHGVLDEWFENEVKPRLRGAAHEIRFADDAVLCFQYKEDAEKVREVLPKRFAKYGLTLHPEKTRLVEFGRYAEVNAKRQGKKPGTLDFLGFTHICTRSRKGKFTVHIRTMKKRFRRGLTAIAEWCQENRHVPVDEQQKTLNAKLRGHYQYYGRPTNYRSILRFYREIDQELILTRGFWERQMGSDPNIWSRSLRLNGRSYTVIGIMDQSVNFPPGVDVWVPMALKDNEGFNRKDRYLRGIARLRPDVSLRQAEQRIEDHCPEAVRKPPGHKWRLERTS